MSKASDMTGDDLRRFRERRGLEKEDLARLLNDALGTSYDVESIRRWERNDRRPSKAVASFVQSLSLASLGEALPGAQDGAHEPYGPGDEPLGNGAGDSLPGDGRPDPSPQPVLLSGSSMYARACEDLWEMIATGLGMVGAATGSTALMNDGAIIAGDKAALGAAWGRLAETNETFRRMLVSATEGGVWLQVALATGTTFSRCWQNHAIVNSTPPLGVDPDPGQNGAGRVYGPEPAPAAA